MNCLEGDFLFELLAESGMEAALVSASTLRDGFTGEEVVFCAV